MRDTQFARWTPAARETSRLALGILLDSSRSSSRLISDGKVGPGLKQKYAESDLVRKTFLDAKKTVPLERSTPSKKIIAREKKGRLRRVLMQVPKDYRPVIELRKLDQHIFKEFAITVGRSVKAVKKLWSCALVPLKDQMREHGRSA